MQRARPPRQRRVRFTEGHDLDLRAGPEALGPQFLGRRPYNQPSRIIRGAHVPEERPQVVVDRFVAPQPRDGRLRRDQQEPALELRREGHQAEARAVERLRRQPARDALLPALRGPRLYASHVDSVICCRAEAEAAECCPG